VLARRSVEQDIASKLRKIEKVLARRSVEQDASGAASAAASGHPQRSQLDRLCLAKRIPPVFRKAPPLPQLGASLSFQTSDVKWFS